jgi:hypothetical protein
MALPDLLQWASRGQKSGTLVLRADAVIKRIHFQKGIIVGSSSNDPRDFLGQVLLSEGVISEQQLKEAMDQQTSTQVMLGRILVQWGVVSEARMAAVLRHKAEEAIYSLFLWTDADFEFLDEEAPPGNQVLISVHVEEVLLEGVRRYDTACRIRELLPHNHLILAPTERPLPADIASKVFPKRIHALIDGQRTLAEIILEAHSSEFNVCQVVYVLVQRGFVAIRDKPAATAGRMAAPPLVPSAPVSPESIEALISTAQASMHRGEIEDALTLLDRARSLGVRSPELNVLTQSAEQYFIERAYRHFLPPGKIPVLKRPLESLLNDTLTPEEVFLVSRVNGSWDLRSIMSISPLREVDALRALKKLRERGIIDLVEPTAQARSA